MIGPIKPFRSVGRAELDAIKMMDGPLSGYLAGKERGGQLVRELEDAWAKTFKVKHAIACNSATSGLLAACVALGVGPGSTVAVPSFTMSATAAAPAFLGATLEFSDVDDKYFCVHKDFGVPDVLIVTNLFGHPTSIGTLTSVSGVKTIEDNSQAPFAMNFGRYAGTIADIGVFSLNVHKPIQCGEGGVIVTDDDDLAAKLRAFINHGEHVGPQIGLNLRMPEVCAAIALVQLQRGEQIVQGRIDQATAILAAIGDIPGLRMPIVRKGCRHVYYTIPFLIDPSDRPGRVYQPETRSWFCNLLRDQGVPIVEGYVPPLYRMPAFAKFARSCPVAEDLHDRRLFYFENCAHDVTLAQAEQIGTAFRKAAEMVL